MNEIFDLRNVPLLEGKMEEGKWYVEVSPAGEMRFAKVNESRTKDSVVYGPIDFIPPPTPDPPIPSRTLYLVERTGDYSNWKVGSRSWATKDRDGDFNILAEDGLVAGSCIRENCKVIKTILQ